jgi:hypothetical protein
MTKLRSWAFAVLALAPAAVVLPASPASAGTATVSNGCTGLIGLSQIEVTTSGDDGLSIIPPVSIIPPERVSQTVAIPGAIVVDLYNDFLMPPGVNNIPVGAGTTIEATNTIEGVQDTGRAGLGMSGLPDGSVTATTTISDPDGIRGSGDETATDATFSVDHALDWISGPTNGTTIEYRQDTGTANPPTSTNNTLSILMSFAGGASFRLLSCTPGTVDETTNTMTLIDPAPSYDTTLIQTLDAAGEVIVSGPTKSAAGSDVYVFRITNTGPAPFTIDPRTNISATVMVNGSANGSVSPITGTKTIGPGERARFRLSWTHDAIASGSTVEYTACVIRLSDATGDNNCDSETRTSN